MTLEFGVLVNMLDDFKQPEYTGKNRCIHCTILNIGLLVILSALVASGSIVGGVILAAGGTIAIWLRGYFVPYTPRVGPQIMDAISEITSRETLPKSVDGSLASDAVSGEKVVEGLLRADILESTDDEDLELSETFRNQWRAEMRKARTLELAEFERWAEKIALGDIIVGIEAKEQLWSDPYVVVTLNTGDESVLRYPVAVAEFASLAVLEGTELEPTVCLHASGPLRGFLTDCPLCDSSLDVSRFDGCCGNPRREGENPGLVCKECRTVLYKYSD